LAYQFVVAACLIYSAEFLRRNIIVALVFVFVIAFPLSITLIGADFYRWVCMSANAGLLAIMFLARSGKLHVAKVGSYMLLAFCLLAPLGSNPLDRPLPMHQLFLEKLLKLAR